MRVTAIHAQTERKRQDRSVRRAEKRRRPDTTRRLRGPICPVPAPCAPDNAAQDGKYLSSGRIQAIFTSDGMPLGECRVKRSYTGSLYICVRSPQSL